MNILYEKFKEVLLCVLPIVVIVLLLHFFLTPLSPLLLIRFALGAVFVIVGLSIFLCGVDLGITPLGNHIGSTLSKKNKVWIIVAAGLILGFFISVAEPDLQILAGQVAAVTGGQITKVSFVVIVSVGIAVMLVLGFLRIVYNFPLNKSLTIMYALIFIMALFVPPEYLAMSFDASGATTGALTVPFILALAIGVSALKMDSKASEKDSFGLVAITSTGAIWSVIILGFFMKNNTLQAVVSESVQSSPAVFAPFLKVLPTISFESAMALLPVLVIFIVFQVKEFRFSHKARNRILKGILYTLIGLILFLVGVNAGFMELGSGLGYQMGLLENKSFVVVVGFVLGFVTILAEPAVHVLTHQIEMVTSGYVKKRIVLGALCIGVGFAVGLSILRIVVPSIQLWHYLLPGFAISLLLSFLVPKLFVGIAFDSGGVASGPMTATFILAFAQGVASSVTSANVLTDAFGMIALVAMTPIITLQILGGIYKLKLRKPRVKKT